MARDKNGLLEEVSRAHPSGMAWHGSEDEEKDQGERARCCGVLAYAGKDSDKTRQRRPHVAKWRRSGWADFADFAEAGKIFVSIRSVLGDNSPRLKLAAMKL